MKTKEYQEFYLENQMLHNFSYTQFKHYPSNTNSK